ncbi:MAG: hypothetical protein KC656_14300 [Myxococcales bacterium]|nr:hypothetical protein [Myxococcales bacterium]MCB9664129.1 hypothetical protein [Alphaproteobacteria bacterium]
MTTPGRDLQGLLVEAHDEGGFVLSVLSTQQGLPVASVGHRPDLVDTLAALTALFDDVVVRAQRDVGLARVDEVALRDEDRGSVVVRPICEVDGTRLFLVVEVPARRPWRRVTNRLCRAIAGISVSRLEA